MSKIEVLLKQIKEISNLIVRSDEAKDVIYNFYRKKGIDIREVDVDTCKRFMHSLEIELGQKPHYEERSEAEQALFSILLADRENKRKFGMYSGELVHEFKNVLEEVIDPFYEHL